MSGMERDSDDSRKLDFDQPDDERLWDQSRVSDHRFRLRRRSRDDPVDRGKAGLHFPALESKTRIEKQKTSSSSWAGRQPWVIYLIQVFGTSQ